jgi:hypothetical protein
VLVAVFDDFTSLFTGFGDRIAASLVRIILWRFRKNFRSRNLNTETF